MTCSWAACDFPAVAVVDGWPSCLSREHHINDDENARPCAVCGEPYISPVKNRRQCDDCRANRRHSRPTASGHGTCHGYKQHRAAREPPCDACADAQSTYDRARYQQRKTA